MNPLIIAMSGVFSVLTPKTIFPIGDLSEFLSHDSAVVEAYRTDTLVFTRGTSARLGKELMKAMSENTSKAPGITVPLLHQCGSDDKLVYGGKTLSEVFTMQDKTILIYEGFWHEAYNERDPDKAKALNDLHEWLDKRV